MNTQQTLRTIRQTYGVVFKTFRCYADNLNQRLTRDRENNRQNKEQGLNQALSDKEVQKRGQDDRNFSPASIDQNVSNFNNDNAEPGNPSTDPELDAILAATRP